MPVLVKKPHKHSASVSMKNNRLETSAYHVRSSSLDIASKNNTSNLTKSDKNLSISENEQSISK